MKIGKSLLIASILFLSACTQPADTTIKQNDLPPNANKNIMLISRGCNFNNSVEQQSVAIYPARAREKDQIQNISKYAGLPTNFEIYSADIANAVAFIHEGKRMIIYDRRLLDITDQYSSSYWSSMSILAHEIGHHLSGHTLASTGSNFKLELEADQFSGFVLQKMGANLSDAQYAMQILADEQGSFSHPGRAARLAAIKKGWEEANKLRYKAAVPPPPEDIVNPDGGVDELKTENLIDEPSYESIKARSGYGFGISDKMDGIILEANDDNYYTVLVKRTSEEDNYLLNKTVLIQMYDPWDSYDRLGRAQYSWLDAIMVPGRRIRFAFWGEGTANVMHFVYIKSLPGSMY